MEGRQAAIIAHCMAGDLASGRTLLAQSDPTQPWEQEVAACLQVMCTEPTDGLVMPHVMAAVARYSAHEPVTGYASYRARLGLTIATLANSVNPDLATELLNLTAQDAIESADGYAAREVLALREPIEGITDNQRRNLSHRTAESGLGVGKLPQPSLLRLTAATDKAAAVLNSTLAAGKLADVRVVTPNDVRVR